MSWLTRLFKKNNDPQISIKGLMRTLDVVINIGKSARIQRLSLIIYGRQPRVEFGLSTYTTISGDPSGLVGAVYPIDTLVLVEFRAWLMTVYADRHVTNPLLKIVQQENGAVGFFNQKTGDAFVLNFLERKDERAS